MIRLLEPTRPKFTSSTSPYVLLAAAVSEGEEILGAMEKKIGAMKDAHEQWP